MFVIALAEEAVLVKRFDLLLEEDVSGYKGDFSELIHEAPALYRLMAKLLDDPALPERLSPLVIAAIAYFIAPADIIPEEEIGPIGYVDDIFFCAFVADRVMKEAGNEEILVRNWDGDKPIVPLVKEILSQEKELIGDKKERIFQYIGYD
ncbi:MAG: YkvA family protein [Methanotrichaceae archaeon]